MDFINKYKNFIMGGILGALAVLVLDYLFRLPSWIVGALIGAFVAVVSGYSEKYFDMALAKSQDALKKVNKSSNGSNGEA